ncbi:MAG: TIGR00341 family protein [Pseudomonadota bacterium]
MSLRLIRVTAAAERIEQLRNGVAGREGVLDHGVSPAERGRLTLSLLSGAYERQELLDDIQDHFGGSLGWRMVVLPVEGMAPKPELDEAQEARMNRAAEVETREELYNQVAGRARTDSNYVLLAALSTVVATVGMSEDEPAVVIGAMVIAPLLGPHLALTLGAALGDRTLVRRAAGAAALGIALAVGLAYALGLAAPLDLGAGEVLARTGLSASGIALALASGAAAALSVTTGLSSALVGVMVSVALLPPAAAVGLMLAAGETDRALGAALLLATNVVCVNLAGQVVFLLRGVRPRTWLERREAVGSVGISLLVWAIGLAALAAVAALRASG